MATKTTDPILQSSDELRQLWRESQEAAVSAWQRWAESLQSVTPASFTSASFTPWTVPGVSQLPSPQEGIDAAFDLAEEVLATQRRFLHEWVGATRPVVETARRQTGEAVRASQKSAEQTTRKAQAVAKRATTPDYASMTVEELQDHAAKADIDGRSGMNKDQLVKTLSKR